MMNLTKTAAVFIMAAAAAGCAGGKQSRTPAAQKSAVAAAKAQEAAMKITSPAFEDGTMMPSKYTADGENISPPLAIEGVPDNTGSLALVCDDPDAVTGMWVHWLVWNIPPDTKSIAENTQPQGTAGRNDFRRLDYGGPAPPSGTHRYFFKLYALDGMLDLKEGSTKAELEKAMESHILAKAELIGLYRRR